MQDEEPLPQECIFGDQFGLAAGQIGDRPGNERGRGGLRGRQEAAAEPLQGGASGAGDALQETSAHGRLPWGVAVVRSGPRMRPAVAPV